jgi:hypothetical protein
MNDTQRFRDYAAESCVCEELPTRLSRSFSFYLGLLAFARPSGRSSQDALASWTDLQIPELEAMAGLHHAKKAGAPSEYSPFGLNS